MQTWHSTGQRRIDAAIQSGKNLAAELEAMCNDRAASTAVEELSGALDRAVGIVAIARARGWCFRGTEAANKFLNRPSDQVARDLNRAFAVGDAKKIGAYLSYLAAAIDNMRAKNLLSFETRQPAREPDKPAAPLKVEVVGLPPRVTKGSIERDEHGNIVKTTQVEMDA